MGPYPISRAFLEPFFEAPADAGIFLDFDGTLSEIVHVPSDARPVGGATDVLEALSRRYGLVCIVSGRSAGQLVEWLGPDVEIWGVHGAEHARGGRVNVSPRALPHLDLMAAVRDEAVRAVAACGIPGVSVEDKGVMLGLHFRAAADVERARVALDEIAQTLAERFGLIRAQGRLAFELRPPVEFTKAHIVLDRARQEDLRAAAFVGDDEVDLPAFDALDELARDGVATLRVAVSSSEAPPALLERADVVVDGPAGAVAFLETLAT